MTPGGQGDQAGSVGCDARRVIRRFADYVGHLRSFRVKIDARMPAAHKGVSFDMGSTYEMAMKRPNKLALELRTGSMGTTVISDGNTVWTYWPVMRQYTERAAPTTLDGILSAQGTCTGLEFGIPTSVDVLLRDDPYQAVMDGAAGAQYLGRQETDGVTCHRVKVFKESGDQDYWIAAGPDPLLRRCVPDLSKQLDQAIQLNPDMSGMKVQVTVSFQNWQVNVDLPDKLFRFGPPRGAMTAEERDLREQVSPVCEKCGQPADVHIMNVVAGQPAKFASRHLCHGCAQKEGLPGRATRQ